MITFPVTEPLIKFCNPTAPDIIWKNDTEKKTYLVAGTIFSCLTLGLGPLFFGLLLGLYQWIWKKTENPPIRAQIDPTGKLTVNLPKKNEQEELTTANSKSPKVDHQLSPPESGHPSPKDSPPPLKSEWNPENIAKFSAELQGIIELEESEESLHHLSLKSTRQSNSLVIRNNLINGTLQKLGDLTIANQDIYYQINIMSKEEIEIFTSRLEIGSSKSLEQLWIRESVVVFSESDNLEREERMKSIFRYLSDEQFTFSVHSGIFVKMMSQKPCAKAAAIIFTTQQLETLASDWNTHFAIKDIIGELPADKHLLRKIVALLPYTTYKFFDKISKVIGHLRLSKSRENKARTKIKLQKLAAYYAPRNEQKILDQEMKKTQAILKSSPSSSLATSPSQKKWSEVQAITTPQYRQTPIEACRIDWSEDMLEQFIRDFPEASHDENKLTEQLNSMNEHTIQALIKNIDVNSLYMLWNLDSKTLQAQSSIELRNLRLACLFRTLSDEQLLASLQNVDFLNILNDNSNGCSEVAAKNFNALQFKMLTNDYKNHKYLRSVIESLPIDGRLLAILNAIIPNISPWLDSSITKIIQVKMRAHTNQEVRKELLALCKQGINACYKDEKLMVEWAIFKMKNFAL